MMPAQALINPEANDENVAREWFTAAELADLALPGMPADKRSLNRRAREERWNLRLGSDGQALVRPRIGRGGGTEFHVSLLPPQARLALAERGITSEALAPMEVESASASAWRWYEAQGKRTKAEAERRAAIIAEVELLEEAGTTRTTAIGEVCRRYGIAGSTVWNWLGLIDGLPRGDRLPALAPRFRPGGKEAEIDPEIWRLFKSDFLRQSAPTLSVCYAKAAEVARLRGVSMPSEAAFRRKVKREIDPAVLTLARKGEEALRRSQPALRRSVAEYHALELVNMDGHKFDVFVTPEGGGKPIRPILIGIQDVYSRKLLAWRIGTTETAWLTQLVFADLFRNYGIPKKAFLDNGRAFTSKWITGGAKNRFRGVILDTDPTGLLTSLGVDARFTLPYRGQSKPIERAWKELCDTISRSAAFEGAYTGPNSAAKPENYGKRAVPWAEFVEEVNRGIAFYNARKGRRTETARGRSFDEVFAESYATAPIGKATPEAMRMALLTAENVTVNRQTGEISLYGNRYYGVDCGQLHGQRVTVRFDPGNLHREIYVYALSGQYLGRFDLWENIGFADIEGARLAGKLVADQRKHTKAALEAEQLLDAAEVAAQQRWNVEQAELPEPAVIRPQRHRGQTAAALKAATAPQEKKHESRIFAALGNLRVVE